MTTIRIVASLLALFLANTVHAQTISTPNRVQFSVRLTQPATSTGTYEAVQISLNRALEIQQVSGQCTQVPLSNPATVRSISLTAFNTITPLTPMAIIRWPPDLKEQPPTFSNFIVVDVPVENGTIDPTQVKLQAMPNGTGNALTIGMHRSTTGSVASCFISIIGEWK